MKTIAAIVIAMAMVVTGQQEEPSIKLSEPPQPIEIQKLTDSPYEPKQALEMAYIAPQTNEAVAWQFLKSKGLNDHQVAGIAGNLRQEHNFKTDDVPGGLGIAQWMGGRRAALISFAGNRSYTDIHVQLEFLWHELSTTEKATLTALREASDVATATRIFQNKFERCGDCREGQRINYAQELLNKY